MSTARSFPSLTATLLLALSGASGWSRIAWPGEEQPTGLVLDLGSESWNRRENAQSRLLESGLAFTSLLEEASRSANPELAYRARYVLSRIDPELFQCQILKIELGAAPAIAAAAAATGSEDGDMVALPTSREQARREKPAPTGGYPEDPTYTVNLRSVSLGAGRGGQATPPSNGGRVEITVTQQSQGALALELRPVLLPRQSIAILRTGDQLLYERVGIHLSRERHPFLTLIRTRAGRKTSLTRAALPEDAARAIEQIVDEVVEQLNGDDPDARRAALEIESHLRSGRAAAALRGVLATSTASPDERALAALGLDDPALLRQTIGKKASEEGGLVQGAVKRGDTPDEEPKQEEWASEELRIRAAARLLEQGDDEGLDELLARLAEGNPSTAHEVMASLANFLGRDSISPAARKAVFEAVYSEDFLGHSIWEDSETEYLLTVAAGVIDPALPEAAAWVSGALENLAKLAKGELGPVNVRIRPCLEVWRRVKARSPGDSRSELDFVLELLPSLRESSQISEAVGFLEAAIQDGPARTPGAQPGQLDDAALDRLLRGLLASAESESTGLFPSTVSAMLRLTRALTIGAGQLRRVVQALVEAGEWGLKIQLEEAGAPTPIPSQVGLYLRQIEDQLVKWTALGGANRRVGVATFNAQAWREWLAQDEPVKEREREIIAKGGQLSLPPTRAGKEPEGKTEPERAMVYYEFDLQLEGTGLKIQGMPALRVLDGHRIELSGSQPVHIEDRWGNKSVIRVEPDSSGARTQDQRFRVNSRIYLSAGIPNLTTVQSKTLSVSWVETSDQFFGSRALSGQGTANYRTLYCVDFLDTEPAAPPAAASATELWPWFLEQKLLRYRPDASVQHWNSVLGVLRALRLKESAPLLKEILKSQGSSGAAGAGAGSVGGGPVEIAQQLLELGDPAGQEFLMKALESPNQNERMLASLPLSEAGSSAAMETLLGVVEKNDALARTQGYRIVAAIDAFLSKSDPTSSTRKRTMAFLVSKLDDLVFQHRGFMILARESGLDFGFESAQALNDPQEKSRTVGKAVQAARAWWAIQSQK